MAAVVRPLPHTVPLQSMPAGPAPLQPSPSQMLRSPTFFVGAANQRGLLDNFQRREQQLSEQYQKHKPLCFNAQGYQKTHPGKASQGHRDADATLSSPMLLGVADGVSQIEEYGIDSSALPRELLARCEELAAELLVPGKANESEPYGGPISLLRAAWEATESMGSTTALLAVMDNSTRIHGKLHPMVAVITVGDCELLMLRRYPSHVSPLEECFHTEMQRIDGHNQTPLQLARVDDRIDPEFTEDLTLEVIDQGSAVHCISAYAGDIIIMGSDGTFDNLFLDELVDICNAILPPRGARFSPTDPSLLALLAQRIVEEAHAKSHERPGGRLRDAPIGPGGKMDDTCVVVGEVIEWTEEVSYEWMQRMRAKRRPMWDRLASMPFAQCVNGCQVDDDDSEAEEWVQD